MQGVVWPFWKEENEAIEQIATALATWLHELHPGWLIFSGLLVGGLAAYVLTRRRFDHIRLAAAADMSALEAATDAQNASYQEQLQSYREQMDTLRQQFSDAQTAAATAAVRLDETSKHFNEREQLLQQNSMQLQQEFERLATKVFDTQEAKQTSSLVQVMGPLREQLGEFKARVEEVYHADIKERATLLGEVKNLQQASERINAEAENLTAALKGDKKLQGNWGELVLERVLEGSGLRRDHEYFVQSSERNQAGDLKRPDVVVRLPEQRDVVVDAKVSLNAYEQAHAESDEQNRARLLRTHANNLRSHVKRLSEQDYDQLPNVRSLDFVLLFVPIESAFASAMKTDEGLFNDAFNQRIVIVSPTTLMMTLRIINNIWRVEKQGDNAQEIAQRAGALYDKLRLLVDDLETLGRQLQTVERTYEVMQGRLVSGKGNLVRQVEQLRELGAVVKKPISAKLLDSVPEEE